MGFEGGEPFLFFPLLVESVRAAADMGFKTAIETNTYWATSEEDAQYWLKPLKEAGLSVFEASDDGFHHEDERANSAKRALFAATKIGLKTSSICIKKSEVEEKSEQDKGEPIYLGGPKLRGRAAEKLIEGLPTKDWETFTECPFEDFRNPSRVHIDPLGNVHICQGISMGNLWEIPFSEMVKTYHPETHPIGAPLLSGGPAELVRTYGVKIEEKYVDACHLCTGACLALINRFPDYLRPRQVYGLDEAV